MDFLVFIEEAMKEEGFTDFDIDPTKIFFEEGEGLENSE